jgi:hypothetical protein
MYLQKFSIPYLLLCRSRKTKNSFKTMLSTSTNSTTTSNLPTCLVLGGAGFIGSHVARRLKDNGNRVIIVDLHYPKHFEVLEICDRFILSDLRNSDSLSPAFMRGVDWVFLFASDMGGESFVFYTKGMGFISNNSYEITQNNTRITLNTIKACMDNSISRLFLSSSACVYPVEIQSGSLSVRLSESLAWPANPQDGQVLFSSHTLDTDWKSCTQRSLHSMRQNQRRFWRSEWLGSTMSMGQEEHGLADEKRPRLHFFARQLQFRPSRTRLKLERPSHFLLKYGETESKDVHFFISTMP